MHWSSALLDHEGYRALFHDHPQPMWVYDPATLAFLAVNAAAVRTSGRTEVELIELTKSGPPSEREVVRTRLQQGALAVDGQTERWRYERPDGTFVSVDMVATSVEYDGIAARLIVATDVTEEVRLADRLHEAAAIIEATTDAIVITDAERNVTGWNAAAVQLFQVPAEEAIGRCVSSVLGFPASDAADSAIPILLAGGRVAPYDQVLRLQDGRTLDVSVALFGIHDREGNVVGIGSTTRDMSERRERELERQRLHDQLLHAARHDPLTGLPNRTMLLEHIRGALRDGPVGVLFCDVDRFKLINDSRDHATGDFVLAELARRMVVLAGSTDTVARFGGDELVIVHPLAVDEDEADLATYAEEVRAAAQEPIDAPGGQVVVTLSVGLASATVDTPAEDLLRDADVAMYLAKQRGRARVERFDDAARAEMVARVDVESRLRRALDLRAIRVGFQPIVSLIDGTIGGFEALARWDDEELGPVPPDRFVPIAEESRLVIPLGEQVLLLACEGLVALGGHQDRSLFVAVNLSSRELVEPDLVARVADATAAAGVHPWQLAFEVTESSLLDDLVGSAMTLDRLRSLGCRIALDDFGTGYSSLSHLKHLPLDTVKIDRSFVAGIVEATREAATDAAIVSSVVRLADVLGHDVVAEGIEEPGQLRALRRLGVDHGQGYLFAPALPIDDAAALLDEWRPTTLLQRLGVSVER